MAMKKTLAAAVILSFFLALPISSAVNQPATDVPAVELYPGESTTINLVYFSDRDFLTYLDFTAFGEGSSMLSFEPYIELPAGGVAYLPVTVSVPSGFAAPAEFRPVIGVIQTQIVDPSSDEMIDSKSREIRIVVKQLTSSNTSSGTSSNTSSTTSTSTDSTSSGTSTATNTATTSQAVSNTTPTAAVTETKSAIIVFPNATRDQPTDDDRKDRLLKKAAKIIDKLRGEGKSKREKSSERHEIKIVPAPVLNASVPAADVAPVSSGVVDVGIDFKRNFSDIGVVVNTLEIEDETTESGVVSTPVEIRDAEETGNRTIEIGGETFPDIQQRVVKEEVVRTTAAGEVVRKITKKKAYKYLELDLEGADSSDVSGAQIRFSVEKSWLAENGATYKEVVLNRLVGGEWMELETRMESEGVDGYEFVADSPGFSFFVITAAITADVLTPISIEVPTVEEETGPSDLAGDILGTSKPQPLVILNFSWTLVVIVLGIVVAWKWNDIKRAMGFVHAKENRAKELEAEKSRYQRMKEETTKKYYKRAIGETEFNNLVVEYDRNIIRIETELADLGRKSERKN